MAMITVICCYLPIAIQVRIETLTDYAPYSFYLYKQLYDQETGRPIEGLYADLDGDGEITTNDRYHCQASICQSLFRLAQEQLQEGFLFCGYNNLRRM